MENEQTNSGPRYSVDLSKADAYQLKEQEEKLKEQQQDQATSQEQNSGSFEERVNGVLDKLRPNIRMDGGDIQLIEANEQEGIVKVRLVGACRSCAMSATTLHHFIETILKKKLPEVKTVEAVN